MTPFLNRLISCAVATVVFLQPVCSQRSPRPPELTIIDSGFIFKHAPFEACHASSLVALNDGRMMATWFGGRQEGDSGVAIWVSVYQHHAWSQPVEMANGKQAGGGRFACWNPVLFQNKKGLLFLYYKVGLNPRTWWGEVKTSADNGRSWSAAKKLPDGFLGPVRTKPFQLAGGNILYPSSTETEEGNKWTIHLERTDSEGNNWQKIAIDCDTFGVIQPCILEYGRDTLQLLCRSRQNVIVESWSYNGGKSWSPLKATHLPNPNAGVDAVSLANGKKLLIYNPLLAGKDWWNGRSVLSLAQSSDGHTWQPIMTLEEHADGEYSYPAIIQNKEGYIYASYTYERKYIKYVILKAD